MIDLKRVFHGMTYHPASNMVFLWKRSSTSKQLNSTGQVSKPKGPALLLEACHSLGIPVITSNLLFVSVCQAAMHQCKVRLNCPKAVSSYNLWPFCCNFQTTMKLLVGISVLFGLYSLTLAWSCSNPCLGNMCWYVKTVMLILTQSLMFIPNTQLTLTKWWLLLDWLLCWLPPRTSKLWWHLRRSAILHCRPPTLWMRQGSYYFVLLWCCLMKGTENTVGGSRKNTWCRSEQC